jgi:aminopeptidase N
VLATYTVRIEADKADLPVLLSNGNPGERRSDERPAFAVLARPAPQAVLPVRLVAGDLAASRQLHHA